MAEPGEAAPDPRAEMRDPPDPRAELCDAIVARAHTLGFDAVGFTEARLDASARARLDAFVANGRHGTMAWLEPRRAERADPRTLWPDAVGIISLGMSYAPGSDPLETLARSDRGSISVYARNHDYHDIIKGRLKELAAFILSRANRPAAQSAAQNSAAPGAARTPAPPHRPATQGAPQPPALQDAAQIKVFVDTAPVMEKPLAERAGLGWQGKHTNLVSRRHGSWLFLGEIMTTLPLGVSPASGGACGTCTRCLDICPTDAFPAPYQLDARRCISYLTIEHSGPIPHDLRPAIGNRIYGCDDCLAVCPWNRFAEAGRETKLHARADLVAPELARLAALDDAGFRALFAGSPIKRLGRDRFVRNVMVAIGNSADPALADAARARLADADLVVREAAAWACARLAAPDPRPPGARPPGARLPGARLPGT